MNRTLLLACGAALSIASSSFAGFTVTATKGIVAGYAGDVYTIVAVNDGVGTGTQIKGLEYFYSGAPAAFQVDDTDDFSGSGPDGIPDTVNLLSTSRTRIRASATAANNIFVGVVPANNFQQPNPYSDGAAAFQGAIANTGVTQATGTGFQIARIFLPTNGSGVFSGNLGGDVGLKQPFNVSLRSFIGEPFPVLVPPSQTVNVVFGSIVTNGEPFSADVRVFCSEPTEILSLALGTLPASLHNVVVTGVSGTSPRNFTVSGTVDYSAVGTDLVVPIVAYNSIGLSVAGDIRLHVTPEPASLSMLAALGIVSRRRIKG